MQSGPSPAGLRPSKGGDFLDGMEKLLFEKRFDRATTAILVGGFPADFSRSPFKELLWFCAPGLGLAPLVGPGDAAVRVVDVAVADDAAVEAAIEELIRRNARVLPSIFVSEGTTRESPARFQQVIRRVYDLVEGHLRARDTRQKDGFTWQKHVLANLPSYLSRRVPDSWAGALAGIPAFVCGAGPSLDVSADRLAEVAGRGVIFAADSALKALARRGIRADFAVSIDAAKLPEKCLPADLPPSRIVYCPTSPSTWSAASPGVPRYLVSTRQITIDWLEELGAKRTLPRATESCGSTALELALFLGCAPIYLFGLDLALDPAKPEARNTAEADPKLYAASGFNPARALPHVPANVGSDVPTHIYGDLRALNVRLAGLPSGLIRNVNDRGARLDNATWVPPAQLQVEAPREDIPAALARLPEATALDPQAASRISAALAAAAAKGKAELPKLRGALASGGPEKLLPLLRALFSDKDFSRGLGAFSMKCLPHLLPPVEGDAIFWGQLLDELAALLGLMGPAVGE